MRERRTTRIPIAALAGLAGLFACSCATRFAELERHLDGAAYADALKWASVDPGREDALAAGILERAAAAGDDALGAVRLLAAAGERGRPALERLRDGGAHPADALASIALSRRRPASEDSLDALLSHTSGDVRSYAAATWSDDIPVERLAALLLDRDPDVRRAAVSGLARFGRGAFARELCDAARLDPEPRVRAEALRHGKALGGGGLDLLRGCLRAGEPVEREAALLGLGDLGSAEAIALLEDEAFGLLDETAVVAAAELARQGDAKGRARLLEALADDRPGVRATAAVNLARAGLDDRDARLLALLDDEAPRVALVAAAFLTDERHASRVNAALRRIAGAGGPAGEEARDMLAARGDPEAAEQTSLALSDADEGEALRILARLDGTAPLRPRVVAMLGDERPAVRRAAAAAILR
jgi:HEAT repeat protein